MASYISPANQEMLWRTIQKNALFRQVLTTEQQPIWFREIIGNFYSENSNKTLQNHELLTLNKNTLRFMVHNLKEKTKTETPFVIGEPIDDRLQPQSASYKDNYDRLQNNYNSMHKRNVPKEPDFKEPNDDEKIQNMDELIQQQLKERELEIPKPPVQLMTETINPVSETANVTMKIEETSTDDVGELKRQIETLIHRTDILERELKEVKIKLSSDEPLIIHQIGDNA
jgi:hypothetical protein